MKSGNKSERDQSRCSPANSAVPALFSDQEPGDKKSHRKSQRPLITLQRLSCRKDAGFHRIHRLNSLLENFPRRIRPDGNIKSTGCRSDLVEARRVEAALNGLSGDITNEVLLAVLGPERDERAFRGTDPDSEDSNSLFRRFFRCGHAVLIKFLAIRQENERACLSLRLSEGLFRGLNGSRDVGSAFGDDVRVQFVKGIDHRGVVESQRRLQKGRTREGNQTDPIALQEADEILSQKFCAGETGGSHICRQHAFRGIHGHNDVPSLLLDLLLGESIARLCQGNQDQAQSQDDKRGTNNPADSAHRTGKLFAKPGRDDFRNQTASAKMGPHIERGEDRQGQQSPEPERGTECQGNRLHSVCESRISIPRQARPAIRNHGKRSRYCAIFSTSIFDFSSLSISPKIFSKERVSLAQ